MWADTKMGDRQKLWIFCALFVGALGTDSMGFESIIYFGMMLWLCGRAYPSDRTDFTDSFLTAGIEAVVVCIAVFFVCLSIVFVLTMTGNVDREALYAVVEADWFHIVFLLVVLGAVPLRLRALAKRDSPSTGHGVVARFEN